MACWNFEISQAYSTKPQNHTTDTGFVGNNKVEKVAFCLKSPFPGAWEEEQQWNSAKG